MSKLKVDEIRSADRSVSSSANITLTDAGKVGIGVSSPDSLFEVAGTLGIKTQEPSLYFDRSGAYAWSIRNGDGSGNFPLSTLNVVNNGGTPTMTFKDDGNVGIGTTAPSTKLDFGVTSAGDNIITLRKNSNSVIGIGAGTGYGVRTFAPSDGTSTNLMFETGLISTGDGTTFTQKGLAITFGGNVGIGTTNPGTVLEVKSADGISSWGVFNTTGNNSAGVRFQKQAAQKWWIYNNAGSSDRLQISDAADNHGQYLNQDSNSWGSVSDERMKKDWVMFSDALTKINTLKKIGEYRPIDPVTGDYTSDVTQTGLSAQEVQKILPNTISLNRRSIETYPNDDTEYLGMNYQDVFVLAIKAIQELSAKVTALENK